MAITRSKAERFTVGIYICPNTQSPVPLQTSQPLAFVEWPVVVENCPGCGQQHVLHCENLQHPPVFGYE